MPGAFSMRVRVRLPETDALGVVYYGQYFTYFDLSRLEMLRKEGITLKFLRERRLGFVAGEASCRYLSSARFDDLLTLRVGVARMGNSSVTYHHEVFRGKEEVAIGRVADVLVGPKGKPVKIPEDVRKMLSRYSLSSD